MASDGNAARRGSAIPWRIVGWGIVVILILLPLVAMQFTTDVNWTASDFAFAAVAFGVIGGTFELAVRKSDNAAYRCGVAVALGTSFLLVWINGAVGMIGSEGNPANLMFFVVILMAIAGAIGARFKAPGMARAMTVAGGAQMLIAVIVLLLRLGAAEPPGFPAVVVLIVLFALPWLLSAWLFRRAARD
jgi:hypothetical protein